MAIVMQQDLPGITKTQVDKLYAQLAHKLKVAPGFIAHASGPTATGYFITELWESQAAFDRWLREDVTPVLQQAGVQPPPPPQIISAETLITR
jgi:heme-degrading monooxygenase HmoA